jgi:predicted ATP-dependent protease
MIPRANLRNLMLRPDVVQAVKAGTFHIYSVSTVDEGIEVLTGVPAGERDTKGDYPAGSVNDRVQKKLQQFTEQQKQSAAAEDEETSNAETEKET